MKKRIRKLLRIGLWICGIFILIIGLYIVYVFSGFNQDIDQKRVDEIISEIQNAQSQDEKLLMTFNQIHENALEKSSWANLYDWLIKDENNECPCLDVARRSYINKRNKIEENALAISVKIERKVSQTQCLNYILENFDFMYNKKGVEEAANFYFEKPVDELNEDERIGLVVMLKNPAFYNPKRSKERFDKKIIEVKKQIKT